MYIKYQNSCRTHFYQQQGFSEEIHGDKLIFYIWMSKTRKGGFLIPGKITLTFVALLV